MWSEHVFQICLTNFTGIVCLLLPSSQSRCFSSHGTQLLGIDGRRRLPGNYSWYPVRCLQASIGDLFESKCLDFLQQYPYRQWKHWLSSPNPWCSHSPHISSCLIWSMSFAAVLNPFLSIFSYLFFLQSLFIWILFHLKHPAEFLNGQYYNSCIQERLIICSVFAVVQQSLYGQARFQLKILSWMWNLNHFESSF